MTGKVPDRLAIADPLGADALDFWLGSWAVSWAGGGHGTNTIRRILDDRVIEESFDGTDAESSLKGRSLSVRDAVDGRWRQTWVDSTGPISTSSAWRSMGGSASSASRSLAGSPSSTGWSGWT
jgi:hypothetical protein